MRQAQFSMETVYQLLRAAPPEALPVVGVAAVWLWHLAEDRSPAAACVDGCVTLHHALAEFGIATRVEAIGVEVDSGTSRTLYGQGPRYVDDVFHGHTILIVPDAGRFVDPTVQQFPEVPATQAAQRPLIAQLPTPGAIEQPLQASRGDHTVTYWPLPPEQRQAWRAPVHTDRDADYRHAGANLAGNVFAMLRLSGLRQATAQSPFPRLHTLLDALEGTQMIAEDDEIRFQRAGGETLRLSDIT